MNSNMHVVNVTAQAALMLGCGVQPEQFMQALTETGLIHQPVPNNFADLGISARKLMDWAERQRTETPKALTA
jgi:hypothetical protein